MYFKIIFHDNTEHKNMIGFMVQLVPDPDIESKGILTSDDIMHSTYSLVKRYTSDTVFAFINLWKFTTTNLR